LSLQVALAVPFLATHPANYMSRAFEFSRQFLFKWTVNYRFLPETVFQDRAFHTGLLLLQLAVLVRFCTKLFIDRHGGLFRLVRNTLVFGPPIKPRLSPDGKPNDVFFSRVPIRKLYLSNLKKTERNLLNS
jgi:hypothetical protein